MIQPSFTSSNGIWGKFDLLWPKNDGELVLKLLHAGIYFPLIHRSAQNDKFSNKNNHLPA